MADPRSILAKLREGQTLTEFEMFAFAEGLADGTVSDAQVGAFAMAVCLRGLSLENRTHLTHGMLESGTVLGWSLDGPVIDKHSTGGVGDCVSLILAPALAACGAYVPMISGRGLGHTGGTLDKLSAISGLQIDVAIEDLQRIVGQVGCAIVSANADIAPADRRLYGLRDITATVPSIDLITASILSKKLAEGLEALVLDVKCGTGAFMQTPQEAVQLAQSLVDTAQSAGCKTTALVTDMNQPLARAAGNALEMMEVMEALCSPKLDSDLIRATISLGGEVLVQAGLAVDAAAGEMALTNALTQGHAAEVFGRMVAAQGGATDFVARWRDRLPAAPYAVDIFPQTTGYIRAIDARTLGEVVVHLGGGRLQAEDQIDKRVGLSDIQRIGDLADPTTPLLRLHARDPEIAKHMGAIALEAFTLSEERPPRPALIHERIG